MWLLLLAKLKKNIWGLFANILFKNTVTVNKILDFIIMAMNDWFSIIFQGELLI